MMFVVFVLLNACGDSKRNPIDSSMHDAALPISDSSPIDASTVIVDGGIFDAISIDGSSPDALDMLACHSNVAITGTDAVLGTTVVCPQGELYQIQSKIFATGNVLQDSVLQGNSRCSTGGVVRLRVSEPNPISRVEIIYLIVRTREFGLCLQN